MSASSYVVAKANPTAQAFVIAERHVDSRMDSWIIIERVDDYQLACLFCDRYNALSARKVV